MKNAVCYSDFGAIGDGVANDFAAIKAAHDYANENHLSVEGVAGKTYRLGDYGNESVIIKTDTLWVGCAFIIDDTDITYDMPARTTPLFKVVSDRKPVEITGIKTLKMGDTNIGVKLGYPALLHIVNEEQRRYIRNELNQDKGDAQREMLLVDADGNIDPSTPVSWDYDKITKCDAYAIDDEPIDINGGHFIRWANQAPNEYYYYLRHIAVTRSNVTIRNFESRMIKEGATRSPYRGTICARFCNNLTLENGVIRSHTAYYRSDKALLGSYELAIYNCNNVTMKNLYNTRMYEEDDVTVKFRGGMGTDYCRNFYLDGCHLSSFDSHKAAGNITIVNSELEHINCIGYGHVHIENSIVHMGPKPEIMTLRGDYGCIWRGTAYIKDVTLVSPNEEQDFAIMAGYGRWDNWYFGYETCMPHTITISDVRTSGGRPLYIFGRYIEKYGDVSQPTLADGTKNLNPYKPTETVIIESNKYNVEIIVNDTPLFKNTKVIKQ